MSGDDEGLPNITEPLMDPGSIPLSVNTQQGPAPQPSTRVTIYDRVEHLEWAPDDDSPKQVYIQGWMKTIIQDGTRGAEIRESFTELLPPETLFSYEAINGTAAPRMYKEIRDVILARGGNIQKRKGLHIKRALAAFYNDEQSVQDACDLAREVVERGIPTIANRRFEHARSTSPRGEGGPSHGGFANQTAHNGDQPYHHASGNVEGSLPDTHPTTNRVGSYPHTGVGPGQRGGGLNSQEHIAPASRRFSQQHEPHAEPRAGNLHHRNRADHQYGSQNISQHALSVLSKLATRFKDRSDKFGGDDGENWEDIYSTYLNCVSQWGVPEHAALRNIENVLAGQAKTYYKRLVQADAHAFRSLEDVNRFMLKTFHGLEAQEATLEFLSSLSLYEQATAKGSLVEGLKEVRNQIVKHANLVPVERRTDKDQARWLKHAVQSYKWTRATTARVHELDFAQLYATLKCQAIEEDKGRERRAERSGSGTHAKVGDKSLGKGVWYGDVYGNERENPKHKPYTSEEKKPFSGKCFGCGRQGYRRADCPGCQKKTGYGQEGQRAVRAIHATTTLGEMQSVMDDLTIQYGEHWAELLGTDGEDDSEKHVRFAQEVEDSSEDGDDFVSQFSVNFIGNTEDSGSDPGLRHDSQILLCERQSPSSLNSLKPIIDSLPDVGPPSDSDDKDGEIHIPDKVPVLSIHANSSDEGAEFEGVCPDTGASTSVCGMRQAHAYARFAGFPYSTRVSDKVFRFGAARERSLGYFVLRMPTPGNTFIEIKVDVVRANIPLLIGLDAMDRFDLYVNNVRNLLLHDKLGWGIPLVRKSGHMFFKWDREVLFTIAELRKIHKGLYHPSNEKLLNLLRRARPEDAMPGVRAMLREISERCKTCQYHTPKPRSFSASMPGEIIFNNVAILDLLWIAGLAVLHIVDRDTHYSAARFLKGESTDDVWESFIECWVATYTGYPGSIKADSGSVFTSKEWSKRAAQCGIAVEISPVESSNSMGVGERYHDPLRRIYHKVRRDHPGHSKEVVLAIANKAMNDTMGPDGLVPSLLLFGTIPRIAGPTGNPQTNDDRLLMAQTARNEMESVVAKLRLQTVLKSRIPNAAQAILTEGDPVLVWRKKAKASNSLWTGPYEVLKIEGKVITVAGENGRPQEFNATQVKPFTALDVDEATREDGEPADIDDHHDTSSTSSWDSESEEDDYEQDPDFYPYYLAYEDQMDEFYGGYDSEGDQHIYLTELLPIRDPRSREDRFDEARAKEVAGLEEMGTWERVNENDITEGANVMGSRFALSLKNAGTGKEMAKARLVVQGHTDREKFNVVHDSTTLHQRSIRIITTIAGMFGFRVWAHDITQAYLQSESPLKREVYLRPPPELKFPKDQLLKLIKPLYGLADSGDYWGTTNSRHHVLDLGMRPTSGDLSLYYRRNKGVLVGLSGVVVDDTLQCGKDEFWELTKKTMDRFKSKERVVEGITFSGVQVERQESGGYLLTQGDYAAKLVMMKDGSTYKDLRSVRAKLAWLVNTRPDIACAVAKLAQITEATFGQASVKAANKVIGHVGKATSLGIKMPALDLETLSVVVFVDAALANNEDLSSQVGFAIALTDGYDKANLVEYTSRKCRRVTHSSLAGEIMAFTAGFDAGFMIKHDIQQITHSKIPLYMMSDSRGLFDMVTRNSYSAERRLMVDMAAIRESYANREIDGIAHVSGVSNPADAFTKVVHNQSLLDLMDGRMTVRATQWVMRGSSGGKG